MNIAWVNHLFGGYYIEYICFLAHAADQEMRPGDSDCLPHFIHGMDDLVP